MSRKSRPNRTEKDEKGRKLINKETEKGRRRRRREREKERELRY